MHRCWTMSGARCWRLSKLEKAHLSKQTIEMEPSGYGKYRGTSCRKKDLRIMDLIRSGI